ncbi:MAG: NAD(P)/FAD-dependent oxidoreductase [Actinomycetota bacterium]
MRTGRTDIEDVVVLGGGYAGLAAALWLGRYRRRTLVLDTGRTRNRAAQASHGYLGSDGLAPAEIRDRALADVARYETVRIEEAVATSVLRSEDGFEVSSSAGDFVARRLLLASGVKDVLPDIDGFGDLYGRHIFHCSCCDGYESTGQDVLAIGWGEHAAGFALDLLEWGARVTLITNGQEFEGDRTCIAALDRNRIEIVEERVANFCVDDGRMTGATTDSGRTIPATRAFFSIKHEPSNELARQIGCKLDDLGYVEVGPHGETTVEHVYAAGDLTPGEQLVQTAAAEGAVAGIACAMSLRGLHPAGAEIPRPGPDPQAELEP